MISRWAYVLVVGIATVLTGRAQPVMSRQPQSLSLLVGAEARFTVVASSVGPVTYQWQHDGQDLSGATSSRLTLPGVGLNDAGAYTVIVRNSAGTVTSEEAVLAVEEPTVLFSMTYRWKYNDSGADPGLAWNTSAFNDSTWPEDEGLFFHESVSLPAPKSTPLVLTNSAGEPITTYYFRTRFEFTGTPRPMFLISTNLVDDGAVYYLNGVEIGRLRMPPGPAAPATPATPAPEGQFKVHAFPVTNLMAGVNVLAVEVHQHPEDTADVVFGMAASLASVPAQLGDLVVWGPSMHPRLLEHIFSPNDCEVQEGLVETGKRRLLSFATETRNIGSSDIVVGSPNGNPEFVYHGCHGHFHYDGYIDYRLVDLDGKVVVPGGKASSALLDIDRWDDDGPVMERFHDDIQGIQRGWADIYADNYSGQYLDVTGIPAGRYFLELEVDPDQKLPELNERNNVTRVEIELPDALPPCAPPVNDDFGDGPIIPYRVATAMTSSECATRESGEPAVFAQTSGRSVWFHWLAPYSGSATFDTEGSAFATLTGLYRGRSIRELTRVARDYDSGAGLNSRLVANVTAGTLYSVLVDGFYPFRSYRPAFGEVILNINSNGNDHFEAAQPLIGTSGSITGTTLQATRQTGEPTHGGYSSGHSIWYVWTALQSGFFAFDTRGSRYDCVLAIYRGPETALTPVEVTEVDGRLSFWGDSGIEYRIALDGRDGSAGIATLTWSPSIGLKSPLISGDAIQFTLLGLAGDRCVIETSPDLLTWNLWARVTNQSGTLLWTDSLTNRNRHYRAYVE